MKLRVIAVGKLKDAGLRATVDTFLERSQSLTPVELLTVKDLGAVRKHAGDTKVVLDERGDQVSTRELASWVSARRDAGERRIDFLVGDAHGFDDHDRKSATRVMALSRLTLPHRVAQLVLVEQLYRVGTLLAGHPYHHD